MIGDPTVGVWYPASTELRSHSLECKSQKVSVHRRRLLVLRTQLRMLVSSYVRGLSWHCVGRSAVRLKDIGGGMGRHAPARG